MSGGSLRLLPFPSGRLSCSQPPGLYRQRISLSSSVEKSGFILLPWLYSLRIFNFSSNSSCFAFDKCIEYPLLLFFHLFSPVISLSKVFSRCFRDPLKTRLISASSSLSSENLRDLFINPLKIPLICQSFSDCPRTSTPLTMYHLAQDFFSGHQHLFR